MSERFDYFTSLVFSLLWSVAFNVLNVGSKMACAWGRDLLMCMHTTNWLKQTNWSLKVSATVHIV